MVVFDLVVVTGGHGATSHARTGLGGQRRGSCAWLRTCDEPWIAALRRNWTGRGRHCYDGQGMEVDCNGPGSGLGQEGGFVVTV